MRVLLIICPNTGKYMSTGVEPSGDCTQPISDKSHVIHCPHCHKCHLWEKGDAIICSSDRWSDVPEIENCYLQAMAAEEKSATALSKDQRDFYRRMERKWVALAEGYRFLNEVARRHDISRFTNS